MKNHLDQAAIVGIVACIVGIVSLFRDIFDFTIPPVAKNPVPPKKAAEASAPQQAPAPDKDLPYGEWIAIEERNDEIDLNVMPNGTVIRRDKYKTHIYEFV